MIQTMLRQFHGFDYILGWGFPGEGLAKLSAPKNWMDHICWRSVSRFIPYINSIIYIYNYIYVYINIIVKKK